jgi:hypothetical protein
VLYICIASNKFDLKQTIRVLHITDVKSFITLGQGNPVTTMKTLGGAVAVPKPGGTLVQASPQGLQVKLFLPLSLIFICWPLTSLFCTGPNLKNLLSAIYKCS